MEATAQLTPLEAAQYGTATATDAADSSPTVTSNAPSTFPLGTTTITWTATDDSGNNASAKQAVTVRDTTAPAVTAPPDITAEAAGTTTPVQTGTATASDAVDSGPTITSDAPSTFPLGTTTVTWTAADSAGNSAVATQTVTVRDTTAPSVTAPSDAEFEATAPLTPLSASQYGAATARDAVDSSVAVTSNAPSTFPLGTTTITWTATDDSGNSAVATQTVTVRDTTAPSVTAPADATLEATAPLTPLGAVQYGTATATDIADPGPAVASDAPAAFPLGATAITWTATDSSGNSATDAQTVTLRDTTAPAITAPSDITAEATGLRTPVLLGTATATDAVDPSVDISNDAPWSWNRPGALPSDDTAGGAPAGLASGADRGPAPVRPAEADRDAPPAFPLGTTTVTWTATDDSGNSATDTQTVTVRDTAPPSITAPPDITAEATGILTVVALGTATATDLADPRPTVASDAPASFPLGATAVTWTATDSAGNSATATQMVTIQDTTPPAITAPGDITAEATGLRTGVELGTATATDAVDPSVDVSNDALWSWNRPADLPAAGEIDGAPAGLASGADRRPEPARPAEAERDAPPAFPLGSTTVTWTATDSSGNSATDTQTVTIQDTTPPAITAPPDVAAEATGALTAVLLGTATATDLADPGPAVASDAPSAFPLGATAVTWTATDGSGNSATDTQTVTVRDTAPPAIAAPPDITAEATGILTVVDLGTATATDLADADVEITSDAPGQFPLGTTTVTWTATDGSGNSATDAQTVTLVEPVDILLRETFDSMGAWTKDYKPYWRSSAPGEAGHPPGHAPPNRVAKASSCDGCAIVLDEKIDLSGYSFASLSVWRHVEPAQRGLAYVNLLVYQDGDSRRDMAGAWSSASDSGRWVQETVDLSGYLGKSGLRIQLYAGGGAFTDVMLDDLTVYGTPVLSDSPPAVSARDFAAVRGSSATAAISASDPDGDPITLSISGNPGFVTLSDGGSGPAVVTASPSAGDAGEHRITVTASSNSRTATAAFSVHVLDSPDTTAPEIAAPGDMTVEASGYTSTVSLGSAAASDDSGAEPHVANDAPDGFPLGSTTVTWTATDSFGNSSADTQTVTVTDTTAPVFEGTELAPAQYGGRFVDSVVAVDAVDGDLTASIAATGSVDASAVGPYPVSYSVSDSSGNTAQFTGTVYVVDWTPPVVTLRGSTDVLVRTGGSFADPGATAVDPVVDAQLPVTVGGQAVDTGTAGVYHITYTATDANGNTSTAQRTVTVNPNPGSPPGTYLVIRNPGAPGDGFGTSVAGLDGAVAVGAPYADNGGARSGAVYVFDAQTGELVRTLQHHSPQDGDRFGQSLAAGDGKLLVSAARKSVHLYDATSWARLLDIADPAKPAYPQWFGGSTAVLDNGNLVVSDSYDRTAGARGTVYVFDQQGNQVLRLSQPGAAAPHSYFGREVAAAQNDVFVLEHDYLGDNTIYRFSGLTGVLLDTKTAPASADGGNFGWYMDADSSGLLASDSAASNYSGRGYLYEDGLREVSPHVPRPDFGLGTGVVLSADNFVLSSDYRYGNGQRHGGLYVYDRDDASAPFAFIPNPSQFAPGSGTAMRSIGDNKVVVNNPYARAPGTHLVSGEVFLADTGKRDLEISSETGTVPSSDTSVVPSSETSASARTLPASGPGTARQADGGQAEPRAGPPALLGFELAGPGEPGSGRALVELRFSSGVEDIPVSPWDFEVSLEGGTPAYVAEATPSGNAVVLAVELGAAPDPEGLDVRVLAPWAAAPAAPEGAVEITGIEAHDRSVRVSWNMFGDQKQYKVVIAPASDPTSKFADAAQDSVRHRFVNLEPDTEYEVRVGVRGDDSTQATRIVKTLPAGQTEYYSGLGLGVVAVPGNVELSWTDINDTGNGRYRVERSVDGGPFVEIEKQPGASTETTDSVNPEWHGKQITYRVFEWVGKQKLYSDEVSFVPQ